MNSILKDPMLIQKKVVQNYLPERRSTLPPAAAASPVGLPGPRSMDKRSPIRELGSAMTWDGATMLSSPNLVGKTRLRPPVPSTKAVGGLW